MLLSIEDIFKKEEQTINFHFCLIKYDFAVFINMKSR